MWIIEFIFLVSIFYGNNIKIEDKIYKKYIWTINIINKISSSSFNNKDKTLNVVMEKSLEWVSIFKNKNRILWSINSYDLWNDKKILNSENYKYYQEYYNYNWENYKIIIKIENDYSYHYLYVQLMYFVLFSLPFFVIFFIIWYVFIWKNLKPIKETIDSLEMFTGNINHEMKTPLTEIISTLSLTKETKQNYKEAIESSLQSAKKLNKILDSMLWIIHLVDSSYKEEKVNIIDEINSTIKYNEKNILNKKLIIKKIFSKKQFIIYTNKEQLNICIWNILKNAIKYSHKNWIIEISFDDWILEIRDYWIWIEKKNLDNIYKRYFRENYSKKEWYWLWLALVKKIIDINKWDINIESEKNKWTNVILNFN